MLVSSIADEGLPRCGEGLRHAQSIGESTIKNVHHRHCRGRVNLPSCSDYFRNPQGRERVHYIPHTVIPPFFPFACGTCGKNGESSGFGRDTTEERLVEVGLIAGHAGGSKQQTCFSVKLPRVAGEMNERSRLQMWEYMLLCSRGSQEHIGL